MRDKNKTISKRQEIKENRRRQKQRQRTIIFILIGIIVVVIVGLIVAPQIRAAVTPIGPIVQITPVSYPNEKGTSTGDPNAPVKVDVYEDFRCSGCLYYTQNIEPQIINDYVDTNKVYYTYHFFIVIDSYDNSNASHQAANAALCAAAQNRFWDYHNILYANQTSEDASLYTDARLVAMAKDINLNMNDFNQCFRQDQYNSQVQKDIALGDSLNINSTPSIFVDGKLAQSDYSTISKAIDTALAGK
jgi:protein-disulfide isomerase